LNDYQGELIIMNERWNMQSSFEVLSNKYVGTGHSDMTKWEWGTNIQRDTLASHIGHKSRLLYMSVAQNQSVARTKFNFLNVSNFS
jgi:splicing factor 3B subunit 5